MCRLLLGLVIFAFPAYGLLATNATSATNAAGGGFIYPGVFEHSVANVSDVSVYRNDSMIVEYNQFKYTTTLSISMNCFQNQTDALKVDSQGFAGVIGNVFQFGPYENTGLVRWSFSNGNDLVNTTYCRFLLYNESLTSCSWAPWDQLISPPPQYYLTPFTFSPVFRVFTNAMSDNQPTLWTRNATATQKVDASKTISTTQSATCPPSGIPPSPVPTTWSVERYPPLEDGLEFPFDPKVVEAAKIKGSGDYPA